MSDWTNGRRRLRVCGVAFLAAAAFSSFTGAAHAQRRPPVEKKDKEDKAPKSDAAEQRELSLAVGETKTVPSTDVKQFSEGTPGIIDVRTAADKFIIVGLKAGSTSLLLIKNDGSQINMVVNVFARPPELVERELRQLLAGINGIDIRRVGSRLFIDGAVSNAQELERVKQVAALYAGQVEPMVTVGANAKLNIRIDFFFVQYNKNSGYNFGVAWPKRIGGEVIQTEFSYDFISGAQTARAPEMKS